MPNMMLQELVLRVVKRTGLFQLPLLLAGWGLPLQLAPAGPQASLGAEARSDAERCGVRAEVCLALLQPSPHVRLQIRFKVLPKELSLLQRLAGVSDFVAHPKGKNNDRKKTVRGGWKPGQANPLRGATLKTVLS